MIKKIILALILSGLLLPAGFAQKWVHSPELKKILSGIEEFEKKENNSDSFPLGRNTEGDFQRCYLFSKTIQSELKKIDSSKLNFDDWISWQLLLFITDDDVQEYELKRYLNPLLSDQGFHISFPGRASGNFTNKASLLRYLKTLNDFPRYVDEHLGLMRRGLKEGISQPAIIVQGFAATYNQHVVDDVSQSFFYRPFLKKPVQVNDKDWDSVASAGKIAVEKNIIPQYKRIKKFFEEEYTPAARKTLGVISYPNGEKYYQQRVNYFTTTALSYNQVYETGLKEVARIQADMETVLKEVKFKGSLKEFIAYLRTDSQFYVSTPEALLKEASFITKKIDGQLPRFFGKLPRQPYTVEPVPDYLAPNYTGGRYSGASINSTRSGAFWVNTYNLKSRPLYVLEALALHEAVPGHHLQISLSQELDSVPDFRRNLYVNAFGEGWALYGEYLGIEMGFYKNPYNRFGRLTYEMWRACRLVIDVGLHAKGWTREQAVNYLADHTALSLHEVNTEINRYIAWPGQALSYKMGELKIRELRKKAEEALKENFDIRAFHDMILSKGTVTLSILEKMTERFIAEQQAKLNKKNG